MGADQSSGSLETKSSIGGLEEHMTESDVISPLVELTIVSPTFNEAENVPLLIKALQTALDGKVRWELVFVDDDSPDNTAEIVKSLAQRLDNIRCIHRIGRRGLSSACIEGALSSAAPYVAVIDADLQHDETKLLEMLKIIKQEQVDVVVGSRYVSGGGFGEWSKGRVRISQIATWMASLATGVKLSDPMSGFFMIRREVFNRLTPKLSAMGFKILLDLFASSSRGLSFREVPFEFRTRQHGESKLDSQAIWDYAMLLADKTIGRFVPVRFLTFAVIGGSGVFVHLAAFALAYTQFARSFQDAKIFAVIVAMIWNYTFNNMITYRDKRLVGWGWLRGLAVFMTICALGAAADVGISSYLDQNAQEGSLMERFKILPVLAGIVVGAVWNYAVTSIYTWRDK